MQRFSKTWQNLRNGVQKSSANEGIERKEKKVERVESKLGEIVVITVIICVIWPRFDCKLASVSFVGDYCLVTLLITF